MEFAQISMLALLQIIIIDIVLSGDNAVVIAMATKSLPKRSQNKAIAFGTAGAVILRIVLAIIIVYLLQIPYVRLIGGILLLWVSYNVLVVKKEKSKNIKSSNGLLKAFLTIIVADLVMSFDNVVAIVGAAKGQMLLITIGVVISIPIMVFGSKLIVSVLEKHRWVAYIGSAILAWTAGDMMTDDRFVTQTLQMRDGIWTYMFILGLTAIVLLLGMIRNSHNAQSNKI